MISLRVSNLRSDRATITGPADVIVGICGDLEIVVDGTIVVHEQDFPVAELAADALNWLHSGLTAGTDFEFDSMSTPEPGWVWFRRADQELWRVGGLHQQRAAPVPRDVDEIENPVRRLVRDVTESASQVLGVDLRPFLGDA